MNRHRPPPHKPPVPTKPTLPTQPTPSVSPAAAAGYSTLTFDSTFAPATVDIERTYTRGFEWYVFNFFGFQAPDPVSLSAGAAVINGSAGNANAQICSAGMDGGGNWVGTAFGGGAYFEATLKFDPALVDVKNGWPSWWSMAVEHLAQTSDEQWVEQAAEYKHFAELDFFEYDVQGFGLGRNTWGGACWDWHGVYGDCPDTGFCGVLSPPGSDIIRTNPVGTDYNTFHRYGLLWVPATDTTLGSVTWYFDDLPIGHSVTWSKFTDQPPPPVTPWRFGVVDQQHLALVLGSGEGQPMTVSLVKVWQKSSDNNLVR